MIDKYPEPGHVYHYVTYVSVITKDRTTGEILLAHHEAVQSDDVSLYDKSVLMEETFDTIVHAYRDSHVC